MRLVLPTLRRGAPGPDGRAARASEPPSSRSAFGQGLFWLQIGVLVVVDVMLGLVMLGLVVWALVIVLGVRASRLLSTARVQVWWDRATG